MFADKAVPVLAAWLIPEKKHERKQEREEVALTCPCVHLSFPTEGPGLSSSLYLSHSKVFRICVLTFLELLEFLSKCESFYLKLLLRVLYSVVPLRYCKSLSAPPACLKHMSSASQNRCVVICFHFSNFLGIFLSVLPFSLKIRKQ